MKFKINIKIIYNIACFNINMNIYSIDYYNSTYILLNILILVYIYIQNDLTI